MGGESAHVRITESSQANVLYPHINVESNEQVGERSDGDEENWRSFGDDFVRKVSTAGFINGSRHLREIRKHNRWRFMSYQPGSGARECTNLQTMG